MHAGELQSVQQLHQIVSAGSGRTVDIDDGSPPAASIKRDSAIPRRCKDRHLVLPCSRGASRRVEKHYRHTVAAGIHVEEASAWNVREAFTPSARRSGNLCEADECATEQQ